MALAGVENMLGEMMGAIPGRYGRFVDSFCDPRLPSDMFKNQLGSYTPCFTDVVLLGVAHVVAIILCASRLYMLFGRSFIRPRYKMLGRARLIQYTAVIASLACLLIVLFQIHGRIAAQAAIPMSSGGFAPYESGVYAVTTISWFLFAVVYVCELFRYSSMSSWTRRFSVCLIASCQIAKLRLVIQYADNHDYFFVLFGVYVALQLYLVLLACFHWPQPNQLAIRTESGYELLSAGMVPADKMCPEYTANIFSLALYTWVSPLMRKGYRAPLQFEDIWALPPYDEVLFLAKKFHQHWDKQMLKAKPSLGWALFRSTMMLFLLAIPYKLVNDASQFSGPVFLNLLLRETQAGGSIGIAYMYAVLMLVGLVVGTIADNQHFQLVMRAGYQIRAILVHEVFKKVLTLTPSARTKFTSGFIFNLITSDVEQLQLLCQQIMGFMSSPVRIIVAFILLYLQLGPAAVTVLAIIVIFVPVQAWMVKKSKAYLKGSLVFTDQRSKVQTELLSGIEVVKCSTWEGSFWDRIQDARESELAMLWSSFVIQIFNAFFLNSIPVIVAVAGFAVYVLLGNNLTAAQAFTSLTLFTALRFPVIQLPQLITNLINASVGLKRICDLLSADEQGGIELLPAAAPGENAIELYGDYTWDTGVEASLKQMDLKIPAGSLCVIVGSTGSGKSSVLASILGLTTGLEGSATVLRGTVAYVPQAAFIYNATVRDNILFGGVTDEVDEARYQEAIRVSSLTRDLTLMPAGDMTELGDRGINISGGQKQRLSIARAYYSGADVFLFDDPLSALDSKVGRAVFNNVMATGLRSSTQVLVTNQLQFVSSADIILFMADGKIVERGTYKELMAAGAGFADMMSHAEHDDPDEDIDENDLPQDVILGVPDAPVAGKGAEKGGKGKGAEAGAKKGKGDGNVGELVKKEARTTGRISLRVIAVYVRAMGGWHRLAFLLFSLVAVEVLRIGTTVWLSVWTQTTSGTPEEQAQERPALFYLGVYSLISLVQVAFTLISQWVLKNNTLMAARVLHNNMLARILRAPMSFFHTTPLGRTINRMTNDVSNVDKNLGDFAAFYIRSLLQLIGTIITIAVTTPFALPAILPIIVGFYLVYAYFQASVREVKRMESISRSPVYGTISEAINGLQTIRAYRAEKRLLLRNSHLVEDNIVMSHVNMSMNRWLSVRLEISGSLASFASAVLAIEQKGNASNIGLTITYALTITQLVSMTVRLASVAENAFNAVERMDEYCNLDEEAAAEIPGSIPDHWPAKGKVEFRDVQMRYRPGLPLVLRGLSMVVEAGHKCGVVGRTGAGKSSLINSLFRLMELDGGSIWVDGIDISKIGLKQLRSHMSLIPQVPVLFTGTIRANLDPFDEHTDPEIWIALRRAHLAAVIEASPAGLDMMLSEGGAPLSAGQKQLVALARALLRHSKVLVLDEATANVDVETDSLIQKTVREEFRDNTIIAVAHRLHTVIDCDSVLVMDAGVAGEFGSPAQLLSNPDGIFSSMVQDTGDATAAFLRAVAFGEADVDAIPLLSDSVENPKKKSPGKGGSPPKEAQVSFRTAELVEKAKKATDALNYCLAALREDSASEQLRKDLGISENAFEGIDTQAAHDAMAAALQVVADINALAEQTRSYIVRQAGLGAGRAPDADDAGLSAPLLPPRPADAPDAVVVTQEAMTGQPEGPPAPRPRDD